MQSCAKTCNVIDAGSCQHDPTAVMARPDDQRAGSKHAQLLNGPISGHSTPVSPHFFDLCDIGARNERKRRAGELNLWVLATVFC
jgi:hypothetical protein